MTFYCLDVQGIRIIRPLSNNLTATTSQKFKSEIIDSFGQGKNTIVVDMSNVEELDVKGVSAMLSAARASGDEGIFALSCLSHSARSFLNLINMSKSFLIFPSSEIAVQELSQLVNRA